MKTYFIDLDGTVFPYPLDESAMESIADFCTPLPGSVDWINKRFSHGCMIVLVTARPWALYLPTVAILHAAKIQYHHLLMACGNGQRVLINDAAPGEPEMAVGITVPRDGGITHITA